LLGRLSVIEVAPENAQNVNPLSLCPTTLCAAPVGNLSAPTQAPVTQGQVVVPVVTTAVGAPYVASKAGTKYHHITCPGAKQIKEENKIYFASVQEAMAAGYSKAANCNQ
jgi:hypothetical protein